MESWNQIVNTALLGTDKKQLQAAELPDDLATVYETVVSTSGLDREDQLLQLAAIGLNYRQSGVEPLINDTLQVPAAAAETLPYCSEQALQVLRDILEEESHPLLAGWLQHCRAHQQLVTPEIIPVLFTKAVSQKKLRDDIAVCAGKRGEWLSSLNADWPFYTSASDDETWQNGTTEQRGKLLAQMRQTDPAKALEWLQQTWPSENLAAKTDLLKKLETNLSGADLAWLETLLNEKGQKLKEVVISLLKRIPGSSLVNSYWEIVSKAVLLKKEKALLGMLNKTSLLVKLPAVEDAIFATGIEKLSSKKEVSDDDFILYQLMQFIPPSYWETHFSCSAEQAVGYFQKEKSTQIFLPALASATWHFNNSGWAVALLESNQFFPGLMQLLPEKEQDKYAYRLIREDADAVIRVARERKTEWSPELTNAIFTHTSKEPYAYNRNFYSDCIHLIPVTVIHELHHYKVPESFYSNHWENIKTNLIKLLTLKQQTIQAFKSE